MRASAAGSSRPTSTTSRRGWASPGIRAATAGWSVRAGAGIFYGSITGNEWNTTADNQPFTVRQSFPTVKTLSDPYGNLPGGVGPFPFIYDPTSAAVHAAGAGVRSVARLRLAVDVSDEPDDREGNPAQGRGHGVVCGRARPQPAGEHRQELPDVRARRDDRERQRAAAVPARHHRLGTRARVDLQERLSRHADSAPSVAARASRPRPTTRSARRSRTSTIRAAACRRSRTPTASSSSAAGRRPTAPTASCCPASGTSTTSTIRASS